MSDVTFQLNEFATVAGVLVAATSGANPVLTVDVEPAAWETIDLLEMFHLGLAVRGEGAVSGTAPVRLELRLDPAVAASVGELPSGVDGWAAALADAPTDSPLREHTSWFALSATEAVELPPELAELGDVRSGFTTTWAEQAGA